MIALQDRDDVTVEVRQLDIASPRETVDDFTDIVYQVASTMIL